MRIFISILLNFIFLNFARAGIFLEPYASYETGKYKILDTSQTDYSLKTSGYLGGLRLGLRSMAGLSLSGDYSVYSGTLKDEPNKGTADRSYSRTVVAGVLGYDHGLYRVWLGYGFSDSVTDKLSTGDQKWSGSSYKMGVGMIIFRHTSLNVEYVVGKYTKFTNSSGVESDISSSYSTFDNSSLQIGLGFPFDFGW